MDYELKSFDDLYKYVNNLGDSAFTSAVYRGVKSIKYELVPKIGRLQHYKHPTADEPDDKQMLSIFKQQALPYFDKIIPTSDWDWLTNAQHYGLPTRLLDWTRNPLVACFFAVEQKFDEDNSVIYVLRHLNKINMEKQPDPFKIEEVYKVIPNHINRRIIAQAGLFTVHPEPRKPFESDEIDRLIIPNVVRRELKVMLYKFGIHSATLYPELGGLCNLIQWRRTKGH